MESDKNKSKTSTVLLKVLAAIGVVALFTTVPSIVANKISYRQLKKKKINQQIIDDEEKEGIE